MKKISNRFVLLLLLLPACISAYGYSNPIDGGTTETVTTHYQVEIPWYIVGGNDADNSLIITDGGQVDNLIGYIGNTVSSSNNSVLVSGGGAVWNSSTELSVGFGGSDNTLTIANGGEVNTAIGYIGDNSDNNAATIEDAGSLLDATTLYVGYRGDGNSLTVNDGGRVESTTTSIGSWISSDNNAVTVQGSNSLLHSSSLINVGDYGSSNQLTIANGGRVESAVVNLGVQIISSNNLVSVIGNGSILDASEIYIGGSAAGAGETSNRMEVENGGTVSTRDLTIYSGNNFDLNNGGHLAVSTNVNVSMDGFNFSSGGTLEVGGELTGMGSSIEEQRSIVMNGSNAVWNKAGSSLYVGQNTSGNTLTIADGGRVESSGGHIGYDVGASNNSVVVSGAGSVWDNRIYQVQGFSLESGSNDYFRGAAGYTTGNLVGGIYDDPITGQVGDLYFDPVTGQGTFGGGGLYVGYAGSGNSLLISDGGRVENTDGHIGYGESANGNSVTVSGYGSVLDNSGNLSVGYNGSGNTLRIEDGGHVHSRWGSSIGYGKGANGNSGIVSGENSMLSSGWYGHIIALPPIIVDPPLIGYPVDTNYYPIIPSSVYEGGSVFSSGDLTIGSDDLDSVLVVNNGGSINFTESSVLLGGTLTNDLVSTLNGGSVFINTDLQIGSDVSGNNVLTIGDDSLWQGSTNIYIVDGSFDLNTIIHNPDDLLVMPTNNLANFSDSSWVIIATNEPVLAMRYELSFGDLAVGRGGSSNSLLIADGALVANSHGIIGEQSNAWNNTVSVVGENSEWQNSGDFYIGGRMSQFYYMTSNGWQNDWVDGGRGNSLYVGDGGLVNVGRNMHNRNYSTVSVDPGGHISISSNYYQDATSVLRFGVETNSVGEPLNALVSVGGTAEFEEGATLQYHSNVGVLDFDTFYTNLIVEADQLIIAGVTNANALDLTAINLDGSLVDLLLWEQSQNIYGLVGRRYLADSAGFAPGSMMARLAREIDDMSLIGSQTAIAQINLLNEMSSEEQSSQLTQRYAQGVPTHRHQQGMLGGQKQVMAQSRAFQSAHRSRAATPDGAAGPHKADQGLRGWMRGYGSWADHDGTDSFSGFDQNVYGTVVGLDKAYDNMLLGAAGGYSRSDLTQDNNDSSDADTGFGVLYGSWGTTDWFGDLNLSYGRSRIETRSGTMLGGEGDFDADNYAVYVGGGKEIRETDGDLLFTPEAALIIGYYDQEDYNDGAMDIDAYDRWSYQSRLGAALALQKHAGSVVLKPEVRIHWLHEFNADPDQIGYSLMGGTGRYTFGVQAPDEDILEVGAGFSATFNDRLELVLDVDAQHSELYKAINVSGRIMYEF